MQVRPSVAPPYNHSLRPVVSLTAIYRAPCAPDYHGPSKNCIMNPLCMVLLSFLLVGGDRWWRQGELGGAEPPKCRLAPT